MYCTVVVVQYVGKGIVPRESAPMWNVPVLYIKDSYSCTALSEKVLHFINVLATDVSFSE